ncbi:MAG: alcohol dehydrogenase catalytic domain-containing protein [Lentisphaerae bacterium]|nr:alcohol dehydrogenase catalytic domain-containing protein [Lentisphaerota bacterium]
MKAVIIKAPGVLKIEEVPTPKAGSGEVLLKVEACALCGTDQRVLSGEKHVDVSIVGHEIVGTAVEVGADVKGVEKGKRYVVQTVIGCGKCPMCLKHRENLCEEGFVAMGYQYNGGFAEYTLMPENAMRQGCLLEVPENLPSDIGTLIEPLSCCINGMKYIPFEETEHVVVFGGGIIGVLNALVARARGVGKVTIMDVSQERLDLLAKLNLPFDNLVNSGTNNPIEWVMEKTDGRGVDAVVVAASVKPLVVQGVDMLQRAGHLSIFAGMPKSDPTALIDLNKIHYRELNLHGANSSSYAEYALARDWMGAGKIDGTPLITHRFKLEQLEEAVRTQADPSAGSLKSVIVF